MSRTGAIFAALFIGFLFYITLQGHLADYFKLLWLKAPSGSGGFTNPASTTLQTNPSSPLPGVQNPYFSNPNMPLAPGISPPETGGGFGQY